MKLQINLTRKEISSIISIVDDLIKDKYSNYQAYGYLHRFNKQLEKGLIADYEKTRLN